MIAKSIVIADDDIGLLQIIALRCRLLGLEVGTADSTFGALRLIDEMSPDLVCLDVDMPCGSGLTICESLVRTSTGRLPAMIVLTGRSNENVVRRCHSLGAYYVLKDSDSWAKLKPLICELLATEAAGPAATARPAEQFRRPVHPAMKCS